MFKYTNKMIRCNWILEVWINKCVCCGENIKEDVIHLLLDCKTFDNERKKLVNKSIEEVELNAIIETAELEALSGLWAEDHM